MKRAIVYCRESRDDGGERYERIETQRDILLQFCKRKSLNPVHVIMDDNMSGTDFSRLKRVRYWIETEKIEVFVAKDASRIGRNQLESLEFIRFLDLHGVELLFESEQYSEELFGLFAWLNERRAKEDGDKIRRVLRHKMLEGTLLIKATYGYRILEKRLVIHEEEANNVRFVFDAYLHEYGMSEIAELLDKKFPSENWSCQKVSRILRNPIYCGVYQVGKTKRVGQVRKKVENCEELVTICHHHQPVISTQTFLEVEKKLRTRKRVAQHKYSGLLRCADCHAIMTHRQKEPDKSYYVCSTYNRFGIKRCTAHKVYECDLDNKISQALLKLFQKRGSGWHKNIETGTKKEELERKLCYLERQIERLYEDSKLDGFPAFLFKKKLLEYNSQRQRIMGELEAAKDFEIQLPAEITITKELLRGIADRIEVCESGKILICKN